MNDNKLIIESLSMDLMRVANGLYRNSYRMSERFSQEALLRISEINKSEIKPYFARILRKIKTFLSNISREKAADDVLMYSVLCRNYAKVYA